MLSEDLYKEIILEHFRNPSHCGHLENPGAVQEGVNRSCGDEVTVELSIADKHIDAIRVNSRGCSISIASGSMMANAVEGMSTEKTERLIKEFKAMIVEGAEWNAAKNLESEEELKKVEPLEDIESLRGVGKYPIRVKCATLVWSTLEQALKGIQEGLPS